MADQDFLDALNDCIDRLNQGQSIEDCTQRHPQHVTELRPRLETRALVRRVQPNVMEMAQARDRVRFRLEAHRRQRRSGFVLGRVVGGVLLVLVLMLASASVLAENSLPGDRLYGVKRFSENVRAAFASSPTEAHQQLNARRIAEINRLLALKRAADVDCEGEVQAISGSDWRVADLSLRVAPDVPGAAGIRVGDTVEVQAVTTMQGELIAKMLAIVASPASTATPSPTASSTSTAFVQSTSIPTLTSVAPILGLTLPASSTPLQTTSVPNPPVMGVTVTPASASGGSNHDGSSSSGSSGSNSGSGSSGGSGSNSSGSSSGSSGSNSGSGSSGGSGSGSSGSNSGSSGGSGSNSSGSSSGSSGSNSGSGSSGGSGSGGK